MQVVDCNQIWPFKNIIKNLRRLKFKDNFRLLVGAEEILLIIQ